MKPDRVVTPPPVASDWLDGFVERVAARAVAAEDLRRLPAETVAEAAEAGYFAMLLPAAHGGREAGFAEFLDSTRRIAQGCTSSAWTLSFLALHAWLLCKFEPQLQAELFSGGAVPMAPAPLAPTGTATPVEGGYRVSGAWDWATGIMHSNWVMVGCNVPGAGPRFAVLPVADVSIEDNWHVAGMCATGSATVHVRDAFVPAHRTVDLMQMQFAGGPGEALHNMATIRYPLGPTLALVACTPALGAAEAAVESFTARMAAKVQAYSGARQAELPATHLRLGEALALLHAAQLVWRDAIRELESIGPSGAGAPVASRVRIRLAAATVVRMANDIINNLAAAAGASAGFRSAPLQRALRDVQMMRGHVVFDWDRATQIAGRIALGADPVPADML
jgi:alkylation response protein AidB-like acyl-CoA dehydrogenase